MACHTSYPRLYRQDLENECRSPLARLGHGEYALVPLENSRRRSLAYHINDDSAHDTRCVLDHRPILGGVSDTAIIDRDGPFVRCACAPRCRSLPHSCDDAEHLELTANNGRFPYRYPVRCVEPGGVRWGPEEIQAYNRVVLRYNNQIGRRGAADMPGEPMMLYPMMDTLGRFPQGFDRPVRLPDFLDMDGEQDVPYPLYRCCSSLSSSSHKNHSLIVASVVISLNFSAPLNTCLSFRQSF
jgi:hypothetical protein